MAYDKKSDIGQFNASPGNDQIGQIDIYNQQLSSIGLGQIGQSSMPLGQVSQSSMLLNNGIIKTIDLLDMDQFGHNSSLLRKNLSIVDAVQTNTDKEYGVIQIEDGLEFDSANAEVIADTHTESFVARKLYSTIKRGQDNPSNLTYSDTNPLFLIPNIFYRGIAANSKADFASIQWIGHEYSLTKIGTENIASASGSYGSIGGTSGGEVLFEQGFESNTQIEKLRFIISNNSTVNMHIAFKIWQGYGLDLI